MSQRNLDFYGAGYEGARDRARLLKQHEAIRWLMADGQWRTLKEISDTLQYPPASVSAQLRHLRRPPFGGYEVERKHLGKGLYTYRLGPPSTTASPKQLRAAERIQELTEEIAKLRARLAELEARRG